MHLELDSANPVTPIRFANFVTFAAAVLVFATQLYRLGPDAGAPWFKATMTIIVVTIGVEIFYEHLTTKGPPADAPRNKPKGFPVLPPKDKP